MIGRRGATIVILLFLVGAGIRLAAIHALDAASAYTVDSTGYLLYKGLSGDEREYDGRAWNLLNDGSFWAVEGDGNAPPAFCLWVAGVYALFGRSMYMVLLANVLFGGLTAVATYLLARRFSSWPAATLAGLGVAFDPQLVFWSTRALTETPAFLLAALISLALFMTADPDSKWTTAIALGGLLGLGLALRNNLIIFAMVAPVWWVLALPLQPKAFRKLVVAMLTFLVCASGLFVVLRSQRPPGVTGQVEQFWSDSAFRPEYYRVAAPGKALRAKGSALTGEELAQVYREAEEYIERNPAWKVVLVNFSYELGRFWRVVPTGGGIARRAIYAVHSLTLFSFAIAGAILFWQREDGRRFVLYTLLAGLTLSGLHTVILARPRYRLPLEPLMWILAAEAAYRLYVYLLRRYRRQREPEIAG